MGSLGRGLGEAPGLQCGPATCAMKAPSGTQLCSCLQLPLQGRLDHAALPPPGSPPTSRGAHSRLAASSRGPHAWVHMQVQCTPGRQLSGRASRLNFASSSEKPSRPTRCTRQRVARASLPIVPGRNAANGRNSQLPRPPSSPEQASGLLEWVGSKGCEEALAVLRCRCSLESAVRTARC